MFHVFFFCVQVASCNFMQLAGLFAHESGSEAKFSREKVELLISNQRICKAKAESDGVVYVTDRGILLGPKNPTRDAK